MTFVSDVFTRYVKQATKCLNSVALWEVCWNNLLDGSFPLVYICADPALYYLFDY